MIVNEHGIVYKEESYVVNYFKYDGDTLQPNSVKIIGYFSEYTDIGGLKFAEWVDSILNNRILISSNVIITPELEDIFKRITGMEDPYLMVTSTLIEDILNTIFTIINKLLPKDVKIYLLEWKL